MKRTVSLLLICLICALFTMPCFATEFKNPPVVDKARYLYTSEFDELSEKLEGIRQKYDFEVAIVTEYSFTSNDAQSSADDIYDYQGYGAGENYDGIMLYICKSERKYHITTCGDGLRVFNNNGIEYLKENIQPHLADDEYYLAMYTFAKLADELLEMAENGSPYNEPHPNAVDKKEEDTTYKLIVIGCAAILPLIIAWGLTAFKLSRMKTAVKNDYAANYVKRGSKQLNLSRDIFLYSHTIKTKIPKSDSGGHSGGHFGSHTSSSGRTHGGGGGSF